MMFGMIAASTAQGQGCYVEQQQNVSVPELISLSLYDVVQDSSPKWNEDEVYRFLLKIYSEASIAKSISDSFDPQAAVKQLYDIGR